MSSSLRISDPSKLHLKKELTQITRVAKVLRDPATTSSWKSPLPSSRSVVDTPEPPPASKTVGILGDNQLDSQFPAPPEKEKKVFLYNWKTHKTSSGDNKSGFSRNTLAEEEEEDGTSWIQSSVNNDEDDDVSDTRNCKDSYLGETRPGIFRCRAKIRKSKNKSKKRLEFLSRYHHHHQPKEANLRRNLEDASGITRDESDETEELSNSSENNPLKIIKASSPLLSKLKHKNWSSKREGSSYTCNNSTPALSTSRYPSTVGSWEDDSDDDDDDDDDNLDVTGRQGCGISFYRTKRKNPRHRGGCRSCCSPSFSDTLRKTRNSILCGGGSQSEYCRHRRNNNKHKLASRSSLGVLPLLKYGEDSDLSTDFGELELESQSRLDGRRWSTSCMSHDGSTSESMSHKYKPMFFDEVIGQSVTVQSLTNAVRNGKVAHLYLFQGPRGTGKTSTARIFSAALNCVVTAGETNPCGYCKECNGFVLGKSSDLLEIDASKKNGAEKVKYLLKKLLALSPQSSSRFKVFVIEECHLLPSRTWLSLLKFLENPLQKVVVICVTTDLDSVPRTIQSRSQKYLFNKLRDGDIVTRLRKISSDENLDVESDALNSIALNADGSLRDAETMLDQLSLMGKRITVDLVNELMGVVSDDTLLELLELALSSDTAETVKKARELLDVGADPIVMMSQLASLIMDVIAGAYKALDDNYSDAFLQGRNLSEADMERLKHALKILSEAEKQLRDTTERSTWFIATLLQIGLMPSPGTTLTGSSRRHSSREVVAYKQRKGEDVVREVNLLSSSSSDVLENDGSVSAASTTVTLGDAEKLNYIWMKCIDRCHSKTLKQLLYSHGKLLSITEVEGVLVAYIAFGEREIKARAERFLSSITNSIETVLRRNVEARMILLSETELVSSKQGRETAVGTSLGTESEHEIPMSRIESIIQEQRLETELLQRSPGSQGVLKPERKQVLPREDTDHQPNVGSAESSGVRDLKICELVELQENRTGKRMEHCPVTPSLLHDSNFTNNKDSLYESESGRGVCSLLFCWKTQKSPRTNKTVRSRRSRKRQFMLFSGCAKLRK